IHPPPPPPPPPPAKKRTTSKRRTRIRPVQSQSTVEPGKLVAPVEIPDEIAEEELSDIGIEGGVIGGVEGGVVGGVLGGVVGGVLGGVVGEVEAPIRAVGEIRPPKLLREVSPVYPEIARQARVEGVVIVEAITDIYGRVQVVKVIKSIPLLDQAAVDAVYQWLYEPMVINGRPRGVIFIVRVTFQLR
ncbi:TonB family protein, partial [bacterium]|nr:TonB family protein [bacterium]